MGNGVTPGRGTDDGVPNREGFGVGAPWSFTGVLRGGCGVAVIVWAVGKTVTVGMPDIGAPGDGMGNCVDVSMICDCFKPKFTKPVTIDLGYHFCQFSGVIDFFVKPTIFHGQF